MHSLMQDARFALRGMRKSPGFAAVALLTLAIGIGAVTLMFAVVDAVLIRPLPYPGAEQIVHLTEANRERHPGLSIAYANFQDWQAMNRVFSSLGAIRATSRTLTGAGLAEELEAREVSAQFFSTLGVTPALGRDFAVAEDKPSADRTAILSYGLWQRRFAGASDVVGRVITLDQQQYAIIGVLPKGFSYNDVQPDIYVPIGLTKDPGFWQNRYAHAGVYAVARMRPGVTLEQARADMDRVAEHLQQLYPITNGSHWISVVGMREWVVGNTQGPLLILLGAVGLLLLIACGNIANLLLARGSARASEVAIRLAIGASRARLIRQLLTENVLLGICGGVVGVLLAFWGSSVLVNVASDALPRVSEIRIDPAVLAFAFAISILTGLLFGLAPALHAPVADMHAVLKESARSSLSRGQLRLRSALIVGEVALSLAMLLGAGLLIRSYERIMQVDPGFNTHQLLTATMVMPAAKYQSVQQAESFFRQAMENVRAVPGVNEAAGVTPMPMSGNEWDNDFILDSEKHDDALNSEIGFLSSDSCRTMQVPVLMGRAFDESDTETSPPVAVVNQEFVRRFLPNQNALGRRIRFGEPKQLQGPETRDSRWLTIVGVIGNVSQYGLDRRTVSTIYRPFAQAGSKSFLRRDLVIRTTGNASSIAGEVRKAVAQADPDQALADIETMDHRIAGRLATRTLSMSLLALFAFTAMMLGAIGLYGVVSYWVVQRTREIGVRMALGARPIQVLEMIMSRAMALLVIGILTGLAAALAFGRLMQSMLFGVTAVDLPAVFGATLLLAGVTVAASYLPARRAARVDPMVALRYE